MRERIRGVILIPLILVGIMAFDTCVRDVFYTLCYTVVEIAGRDIWEVVEGHGFLLDTFVCLLLTAIYLPWYYFVLGKDHPSPRQVPIPYLKWLVIVYGMGGIATLWLYFVEEVLYENTLFGASLDSFTDTWSGIDKESYLWVFLSVVLIGPIMEELLFRGLVYGYVERFWGGWVPILVSALAFGIWHGEPVQIVYTAIMGLALGLARRKSRGLWLPAGMHILNNFLSTLPPPLEKDWIYGGIEILDLLMVIPALICFVWIACEKTQETRAFQPSATSSCEPEKWWG